MKKYVSRIEGIITKMRNYTTIHDIDYSKDCWYVGLTTYEGALSIEKKGLPKFKYCKCWSSENASEVKNNLLLNMRFSDIGDKFNADNSVLYFYHGERK